MVFTKKFFGEGEKHLIELKDLFEQNKKGEQELSSDFYELINQFFISEAQKQEIEKLVKTLQQLKNEYIDIVNKRNDILEFIEQSAKRELEAITNTAKIERNKIRKLSQERQEELEKKFLLELGKPLTEKNEMIRQVLNELLIKLNYENGGLDYNEMRDYKDKFKENISKLDLDAEMKEALLDADSNENTWKPEDNVWQNRILHFLIVRLTNAIYSGREANQVLPDYDSKNKRYLVKLKGINSEKKESSNSLPENVQINTIQEEGLF